MIVEPDRFFAAKIAEDLKPEGFQTHRCRGIQEALELLATGRRPTLTLINIKVADGSAVEACGQIKTRAEMGGGPVVLYDDSPTDFAETARKAGADGYLILPFGAAEIVSWMQRNLFHATSDAPPAPMSIPNRFATFPPGAPGANRDTGPSIPPPHIPTRLLLCDDDPLALAVLGDTLEEGGFYADTVSDWEAFRAAIMETRYSVIFLDVAMPGLSGDKLAMFVKQFMVAPRPRVVLFSGKTEAELAELSSRVGAYGYLTKGSPDPQIIRVAREADSAYRKLRDAALASDLTSPDN